MSHILEILVADSPQSPIRSVAEARAVPGRGLEGDRYFERIGTLTPTPHKPDYELTLIEQENVDEFARTSGLPFTAATARRNLVTRGVRLNDLVGREFFVGEVRVRGIRLCEPCSYLAKISWPETLRGLVHKGGLRAQILSEGVIHAGDPLRVVETE